MKIAIGSDHAGFSMKEYIICKLSSQGYFFQDYGTNSEKSMDYPDTAHPLANDVQSGIYNFGILICGSGNGVAITANKYTGIRAALCWNDEITSLARKHNNANILALPARFISLDEAVKFSLIFLETDFEGGRHQKRVEKISKIL
ncbi:MAG: ribose 5-phosphate isomerase B [Bacteroidetes bacterium]|nr:ribose 5-phosphate isomerase B [Bacteroidota bacterium]